MRLTSIRTAPEEWKEKAAYIDTFCLPVYSFRLQNKEPEFNELETVERISAQIERELTGRLLLLPPIVYIGKNPSTLHQYIQEVIASFAEAQFHHFCLIYPKGRIKEEELLLEPLPFRVTLLPVTLEQLISEDPAALAPVAESLRNKIVQSWMNGN